jgi:DNA polymerase-4
VIEVALELLRAYAPPRPVRLLGVRVAGFEDVEPDARRAPLPPGGQLVLPV